MFFTLRPSAHLPTLATRAGVGTIARSSCIARFVQGGVVKTFRCATQSMKIIAILFSLLGIGLHVRMLGFLVDPELSAAFSLQWSTAPLANRALTVAAIIVPFAFYATCIGACFAKTRIWWLTLIGGGICIAAIPYFSHLYAQNPSIARNSVMAALFALPHYLVKPKRSQTQGDFLPNGE